MIAKYLPTFANLYQLLQVVKSDSCIKSDVQSIQDILKNAKLIRGGSKNSVSLGATVVLDMGGRKVEYTLVGPTEANPLEGKISNESPIGKSVMGHKAGESFDFNGKTVKIVEIK